MTIETMLPLICSVVSVSCAVYVTIRNANWRQTDDARAIDKRIGEAETRIQACEIRLQDLPTKADLAKLGGEIHTVTELVKAAGAGVDRIETFWMQLKSRGLE